VLDVGFLSATSRVQVERRSAVVAADRGALLTGLRALSAGEPAAGVVEGQGVRQAVRFADGVRTLHERGVMRFFELGPDAVLTARAGQILDDAVFAAALRAGQPEPQTFAGFLGQGHVAGVAIDWPAVCPGAEGGTAHQPANRGGHHRRRGLPADRRRAPAARHRLRTVTATQGIQRHER